jgi:hypothetical protein
MAAFMGRSVGRPLQIMALPTRRANKPLLVPSATQSNRKPRQKLPGSIKPNQPLQIQARLVAS